jgi:hypothetical protein
MNKSMINKKAPLEKGAGNAHEKTGSILLYN